VSELGLIPVLQVPLFGRISALGLYSHPARVTDLLFILLGDYQFALLEYDTDAENVKTVAHGDLSSPMMRPSEINTVLLVTPRALLIHMSPGFLKVLPIHSKTGLVDAAFDVRMTEINVISLCVLQSENDQIQIAMLYQDAKGNKHVKTCIVKIKEKDCVEGTWHVRNVDKGASMLVSITLRGLLLVGAKSLDYLIEGEDAVSKRLAEIELFTACGVLDAQANKYLLGTDEGRLYAVQVNENSIEVEHLGTAAVAQALVYLDNGFVYVGSHYADSQLIRLQPQAEGQDSIDIVEHYTNLAPISDFCIMDTNNEGQAQLVTCSGGYHSGCLCVVRSGVGLSVTSSADIPGISKVWGISKETGMHDTLVVGFAQETLVLGLHVDAESGEHELSVTEANEEWIREEGTLLAANVPDAILQVTETTMRLLDLTTRTVVCEVTAASLQGSKFTLASHLADDVMVVMDGNRLVHIKQSSTDLKVVASVELEHDAACMDMTTINGQAYCAVCLWGEFTIRFFRVDPLQHVLAQSLQHDGVPRSMLVVRLDTVDYVLVAFGDGQLVAFVLHTSDAQLHLLDRKQVVLGTRSLELASFDVDGKRYVFVSSDRPSIIHNSSGKLVFSSVNLNEVAHMCVFRSNQSLEGLAIATKEGIVFGALTDIQRLHIRKFPLAKNEIPRRIAYSPSTNTIGVLTLETIKKPIPSLFADSLFAFDSVEQPYETRDEMASYFVLFHATTFEELHRIPFDHQEIGMSIACVNDDKDQSEVYVVGSAIVDDKEEECTEGNVRGISVQTSAGTPTAAHVEWLVDVPGAVLSVVNMKRKFAAGVNSKVYMFAWSDLNPSLHSTPAKLCHYPGMTTTLQLSARGDYIAVADLMRSVYMLLYKWPSDNSNLARGSAKLEQVSRDYKARWATTCAILDDDTVMGTDMLGNMWLSARDGDDAHRLALTGSWHLGEQVNQLRFGRLTRAATVQRDQPSELLEPTAPLIYATVSGGIGVVLDLTAAQYLALSRLEQRMESYFDAVGAFSHHTWRSYKDERQKIQATGFIDGDFVERFLELDRTQQTLLVNGDLAKHQDAIGDLGEIVSWLEDFTRMR
jgi:DNA damage-binding protein 1